MSVWEVIAQEHRQGVACVVVTILQVRGSVPGMAGSKAVVTREGIRTGTLGGGRVEARAIEEAQRLLEFGGGASEGCVEHCWNLQRDIGMTCGGEMRFLFEVVQPMASWHIVIFGAGHVAQEVVTLLARLNCSVEVIDTRVEWLERLVDADNVKAHCVPDYVNGLKQVKPESFVLSLTKGHATDRPVLRELLRRYPALPFFGVIGSASKRAVLWRELREDGIGDELLERMQCPVGLPIGSNAPAEIAISIVAQLLERRDRGGRN